jgi:hypothetical protein
MPLSGATIGLQRRQGMERQTQSKEWRTSVMKKHRLVIIAFIAALTFSVALASAQNPHQQHGRRKEMRERKDSRSSSNMQMGGMMQQMGGMMQDMADYLRSGQITPEQAKLMGQHMEHMSDMMNTMSGMMGGQMERNEAMQHMSDISEQMADMHKQMMQMPSASQPLAPSEEKKQ